MTLKYTIIPGCPVEIPIKPPHYEGDVGYDLAVSIRDETLVIEPGAFCDVPTYVRIELPPNTWGDIRPRSSTFSKRRLIVMNSTIDAGYRGEISVFIFNPNDKPVTIHRGDYLAQLVICTSITPPTELVKELSTSQRGINGFGSSGGYKK